MWREKKMAASSHASFAQRKSGNQVPEFPSLLLGPRWQLSQGRWVSCAPADCFSGALCPATLWAALRTQVRTEVWQHSLRERRRDQGQPLCPGEARASVSQRFSKGVCWCFPATVGGARSETWKCRARHRRPLLVSSSKCRILLIPVQASREVCDGGERGKMWRPGQR